MEASIATEQTPAGANGKAAERNVGRSEEIQGVVIEAVFPERLPEINHAITVARPAAAAEEEAPGISSGAGEDVLVCEVQQHLGDDGHTRGAGGGPGGGEPGRADPGPGGGAPAGPLFHPAGRADRSRRAAA